MTWDAPDEALKIDVVPDCPDLTGTNWRLAGPAIALFGLLFVLGGWQLMVFVALGIFMIFMHELGHYMAARKSGMKVTEFFLGFGPRIWSFRRGDTEFGVKAIWLGAYVKVPGMSNMELVPASEEHTTYRSKAYRWRALMASAGSLMHFAMAFLLLLGLFIGYGVPSDTKWSIKSVAPRSAAALAGLQAGDRIVAINDVRYDTASAVVTEIKANPDVALALTVVRGGEEIVVTATPRETVDEFTGEPVVRIGVGLEGGYDSVGLIESGRVASTTFADVFTGTLTGMGRIVSPSGISRIGEAVMHRGKDASGKVIEDRPSSPVGIAGFGADAVGDGVASTLWILAVLNIGIGIFNLIPLLPFDGGHIAIATYERLRSRRGKRHYADLNKAIPLFYATLFALGLLFLSSLYVDIASRVG
jgi:membrane-associated protease RseP (regulator of RpoE activity)